MLNKPRTTRWDNRRAFCTLLSQIHVRRTITFDLVAASVDHLVGAQPVLKPLSAVLVAPVLDTLSATDHDARHP
jgi:hypothetical protein